MVQTKHQKLGKVYDAMTSDDNDASIMCLSPANQPTKFRSDSNLVETIPNILVVVTNLRNQRFVGQ